MAVTAAAACESSEPRAPVTVYDTTGVPTAVTDLADMAAWPSCNSEIELRLGERDGAAHLAFHMIEDLRRIEDGRLFVLNRGSHEVRSFARDGSFLGSFGGRGEGPGEFEDPIELEVLNPDSLIVWDWRLGRLTVFTTRGTLARTFSLGHHVANPTGYFETFSDDPALILAGETIESAPLLELVERRQELIRFGREGRLVDTLAVMPYRRSGRVRPSQLASPMFDARGVFAAERNSLYIATGVDPEVLVIGTDGRLQRIVRWRPADRSVPESVIEEHREARLDGVPESMRPEVRRGLEAFGPADEFPAVADIKVDGAGTLWVAQYVRPDDTDQVWLRFRPSGEFSCFLSLPAQFRPLDFDPMHVAGVYRDELGVEYVEVRRLSMPGL